jgi:hypothetical protein
MFEKSAGVVYSPVADVVYFTPGLIKKNPRSPSPEELAAIFREAL